MGVTPSDTSGCHPVAPPASPGSSRWPQRCHPLARVQLCSRVGSRARVPPREPAARALARVLVRWAQAWACKGRARPRAHTCARPTRTWRPAKARLCTGARWQGCARCQCAGGGARGQGRGPGARVARSLASRAAERVSHEPKAAAGLSRGVKCWCQSSQGARASLSVQQAARIGVGVQALGGSVHTRVQRCVRVGAGARARVRTRERASVHGSASARPCAGAHLSVHWGACARAGVRARGLRRAPAPLACLPLPEIAGGRPRCGGVRGAGGSLPALCLCPPAGSPHPLPAPRGQWGPQLGDGPQLPARVTGVGGAVGCPQGAGSRTPRSVGDRWEVPRVGISWDGDPRGRELEG
ncbi:uncharacterized protein LOC121233814 [Aquila chrysaetos chrysaetos]|uniref:uncharacterized protein LOC121233814 n=1 Tax=Aquila chrysaetos chrysaetos TaxID=223781 RepID=UPI001B7D36CE|nr:uncharacterized protein LOC121233814 [Aquila chrysaetos chrysaetos]